MNKKISEKIFEFLRGNIEELTSIMRAFTLLLILGFLSFASEIDRPWRYFYFWFGIIYMFFVYRWMGHMQKLVSEPFGKSTKH